MESASRSGRSMSPLTSVWMLRITVLMACPRVPRPGPSRLARLGGP
jgi:hypothetical protein